MLREGRRKEGGEGGRERAKKMKRDSNFHIHASILCFCIYFMFASVSNYSTAYIHHHLRHKHRSTLSIRASLTPPHCVQCIVFPLHPGVRATQNLFHILSYLLITGTAHTQEVAGQTCTSCDETGYSSTTLHVPGRLLVTYGGHHHWAGKSGQQRPPPQLPVGNYHYSA